MLSDGPIVQDGRRGRVVTTAEPLPPGSPKRVDWHAVLQTALQRSALLLLCESAAEAHACWSALLRARKRLGLTQRIRLRRRGLSIIIAEVNPLLRRP